MAPTISDFDLRLTRTGTRGAQPGSIFDLSKPTALAPTAPVRRPPPPRRPRGISWREFGLMVVTVVSLLQGAIFAARAYTRTDVPASDTGTLIVESSPAGVAVFVNGLATGVTPARVSLKPGSHLLELRGRGVPRVFPVKLAAGATVTHHVELPAATATGRLHVAQPEGAQVSIDGVLHGSAPLTVANLSVGPHRVTITSGGSSVEHIVQVEAGAAASLVAPPGGLGPKVASGSGWIAVQAPFEMQIFEEGGLLGTTEGRIALSAGSHSIEVVSKTLGIRTTRRVEVQAGKVSPVKIDLPKGTISLNATPWAEVWIDGERVGETPIGNHSIVVGPHEVAFKHPELGEKRHAVVVKAGEASRVSVDLRK